MGFFGLRAGLLHGKQTDWIVTLSPLVPCWRPSGLTTWVRLQNLNSGRDAPRLGNWAERESLVPFGTVLEKRLPLHWDPCSLTTKESNRRSSLTTKESNILHTLAYRFTTVGNGMRGVQILVIGPFPWEGSKSYDQCLSLLGS